MTGTETKAQKVKHPMTWPTKEEQEAYWLRKELEEREHATAEWFDNKARIENEMCETQDEAQSMWEDFSYD